MNYGHTWYKGGQVKQMFANRLPSALVPKTPAEYATMAKTLGGKLWILREPRKVSKRRSVYKQICLRYGLAKPRKKPPVFQVAFAPAEVAAAQIHQQFAAMQQALGGVAHAGLINNAGPNQFPG